MEDTPSLALCGVEVLPHFDQHRLYVRSCYSRRSEFCFRYRLSLFSFAYLVLNT